jgi:hypothetical protein
MDLIITTVTGLLLFLWIITQRAFYNPLYIAFFAYHSFKRLSQKEKLIVSRLALDFCELHIGKSMKKPAISFVDSNQKMNLGKNAGQYHFNTLTIRLNNRYSKSMYSIVRIVLHEYAHHMQFMAFDKYDYQRIFKNRDVDYSNHPWEKQARWMENDFWKACIEYVLIRQGYMDEEK